MFQNHQGGREKNAEHGENYKQQIRDYWEAREYDYIGDSRDDNTTVDLVFRRTYEYGSTDIWVEAKYTKLTRTDKDFLREFATYLIEFVERTDPVPFELHIFVRELSAPNKWRGVFELPYQKENLLEDFINRLRSNDELPDPQKRKISNYGRELIHEFITEHVTVHPATYDVLRMETDQLNKSNRYNFDDRYTSERDPINESEPLEPNFAEISEPPENIYIGDLDTASYDAEAVRVQLPLHEPFYFDSNKVYSLSPPDKFPDLIRQVTKMETVSEEPFQNWLNRSNDINIGRVLLLREISRSFLESNSLNEPVALKYRGRHFLMFEHPNMEVEEQKVENQLVSRAYTEGDKPFVRHRAAQLRILGFSDSFYLSVLVKNHFSSNGMKRSLIRGDQKDALHNSFSQNQYNNSQAYSEYRHWRRILNIHNREKDTTGQTIGFRKITGISVPKRSPGDKDELISRDLTSQQQKLGEYDD